MAHPYAGFLQNVLRPSRYLGGELSQVRKSWGDVDVRVCLAFPDLYDLGMSHLGTKILYRLLNDHPRIAAERAFMPWHDLETELRRRDLPLVSLESARPLRDFDVVGFSLQFELTATNVLAMLELGGIPLRAADRSPADPLVIAGGPWATHPEALAPFIDAFLVGDAEEELPGALLLAGQLRRSGASRDEVATEFARRGGWYAPALYALETEPTTGMLVVGAPRAAGVPERVRRRVVRDLDRFPFPANSPVAATETTFDRMSVEIARGCTEGCRFCQAGFIYRPVRERSPAAILAAIRAGVRHGGYDEASLTSLSPADYSAIEPLLRRVGRTLGEHGVAVAVSSLRAYGLSEAVLDELRARQTGGLTFAPEAGSQRLRDVVSKNVRDEDIVRSAERIFARGWSRAKLYFMLGLPTETDEDVLGIVETGRRVREAGHGRLGRRGPDVTCSVSSFVPKPHTPLQWARFGPVELLARRQQLLRDATRRTRLRLKLHGLDGSWLEAVIARGDRRVADAVEAAYRRGCRFDGWEGELRRDDWVAALAEVGVDPERYHGELPVDARLPWDHIDVRVERRLLRREYRRALAGRPSPPCGKPVGLSTHASDLRAAEADRRKLVCYRCGLDCDLEEMRAGRMARLTELGALEPAEPAEEADPGPSPRPRRPPARVQPGERVRFRVRYARTGLAAWTGHLDLVRELPRLLRRAGLTPWLSTGFRPRALFTFGPALPLGWQALAELVDVSLDGEIPPDRLVRSLAAAAPEGLVPREARRLEPSEPRLSRVLRAADYSVVLPGVDPAEAVAALARAAEVCPEVAWQRQERRHAAPWEALVVEAGSCAPEELPDVLEPLAAGAALKLRLRLREPMARPTDVLAAALGLGLAEPLEAMVCRTALWALDADGHIVDPMGEPPPPG